MNRRSLFSAALALCVAPFVKAKAEPATVAAADGLTAQRLPTLVTDMGAIDPYPKYVWEWLEGGSGMTIVSPFEEETMFLGEGHGVARLSVFSDAHSQPLSTEVAVSTIGRKGGWVLR